MDDESAIETLLEMIRKRYPDATELHPLPFVPGIAQQADANDLGMYVAVSWDDAPGVVHYFRRACKINGKYYYYSTNRL